MRRVILSLLICLCGFSTEVFAASALTTKLGSIESLTPSFYQQKRRAEPTALREVGQLKAHKDELMELARSDFRTVVWEEPGVDLEARLTALREAVYITLGRWGGNEVEAFLLTELRQELLSDSSERAILRGLGSMKLKLDTQRELLSRVGAQSANPTTRFDTLMVLARQGSSVAINAYEEERVAKVLRPLEVVRIGAQLTVAVALQSGSWPDLIWTKVVASSAQVQSTTFAAEALWQTLQALSQDFRKLALETVLREGTPELAQSISRRARWADRRNR